MSVGDIPMLLLTQREHDQTLSVAVTLKARGGDERSHNLKSGLFSSTGLGLHSEPLPSRFASSVARAHMHSIADTIVLGVGG